jgi:GH24 family phage-related lysozyme (muramidase)
MTKVINPPKCGIDLIKKFESFSATAYPDPLTGSLPITIGWGSTRDLQGRAFKLVDVITLTQADILLHSECEDILDELKEIPHYNEMSPEQVGALLSFGYNLGKDFYGAEGFDTITRRLRNKEWDLVPDALLLYVNPGTNVTEGLKRRRIMEGGLWNSGLLIRTTITSKVSTYLKKRMVQSNQLSDIQKVAVPPGKKFSVLSSVVGDRKHTYVELDYGLGSWYIFNDHWVTGT